MLSLLHIENVAVIESVDIAFGDRLNVLTGETGAGKSIIIDALGAILGGRASRELIRSGCDKASVSAVFYNPGKIAAAFLEDIGVPFEEEVVVSRDMLGDGRNICKISGRPVTVAQLRQFGQYLVQTHGQHDSYALLQDYRHLEVLDAYGKIDVAPYKKAYTKWNRINKDIEALSVDEDEKSRRIDMLSYRLNEIEDAELDPGEELELTDRRKRLQNTEKIHGATVSALASLSGGDDFTGASALIKDALTSIQSISSFGEDYESLAGRLGELSYSLEDCVDELVSLIGGDEASTADIDAIESRIDIYYKLKRKYGCSVEELLEKAERWRFELDSIQSSGEMLLRLEKEKSEAEKELFARASELTAMRTAAAEEFAGRVKNELGELDMGKARFEVGITPKDISDNGADEVYFRFSANVGEQLKPLSKVASGGELARIMLAIKNLQGDEVPTLIFDEVDSGVSGRAAQKVAQKISSVSRDKQVLCVTHLAQIAAMGDLHFLIEKTVEGDRTATSVLSLDENGRKAEIARLTGGASITETTLKNASELIEQAMEFKSYSANYKLTKEKIDDGI